MDIHFDVEKGNISRAQIFTDSLNPAPLLALADALVGTRYHAQDVALTCQNVMAQYPSMRAELAELQNWLVRCVQ
ncbi:Lipoate-protein ligase A [compost metagenome]